MALLKETQERIKADAAKWANDKDRPPFQNNYRYNGYIAGATAEAERAQKLVEALELITALTAAYRQGATHSIFDLIDDIETNANNALQQWNAGKEVEE